VKLLLDTHIFLWALAEPHRLGEDRRRQIETQANAVHVSAISVAEIAIKASLGKLDAPFDPVEMIDRCGFEHLEFDSQHAALLKDLPFYHRDPFDRMLIAQSLATGHTLVSDDPAFRAYDCRLL
jgi:PIN domain nuclease of toxin-antitoxin system